MTCDNQYTAINMRQSILYNVRVIQSNEINIIQDGKTILLPDVAFKSGVEDKLIRTQSTQFTILNFKIRVQFYSL